MSQSAKKIVVLEVSLCPKRIRLMGCGMGVLAETLWIGPFFIQVLRLTARLLER